ncbi:MAG: magnesium transporter [Caldilineaceae bacterium]|nr:magnesium transporter [Caldilineaceae bacterium]
MMNLINIDDAAARAAALLQADDLDAATAYLRSLHPSDGAEVLAKLEPPQQAALAGRLEPSELADMLEQLDEEQMMEVAEHLDVEALADVLDEMEPDMAADLLGEIQDPAVVDELLAEMEEGHEVQPLLKHEEDSAGGIMNSAPPCLRRRMTVAEAFRFIKENFHDVGELFYLYVLNRNGVLIGVVNLRALLLAEPEQTIEEIMNPEVFAVQAGADQEEVAQVLARYDLLALPVVDEGHHLVGVVTIDDVVDVIEEEATEDIYRLAQVGEEAGMHTSVMQAIRNRLPWLTVNLGTAFLASWVVSQFESTIAQVAVLAAFMPIVAGEGGNAGTQTMTIVVRSLALGELALRDTFSALWHEVRTAFLSGLVLGILVGVIAYWWQGSPVLGLVIALAMWGNLLVAATVGVLVPMILKLVKVDPALASGIFVTTFTDVCGFSLFLGLATYFLAALKGA